MALTNSDEALMKITRETSQSDNDLLIQLTTDILASPIVPVRILNINKQGEDILEAIARHSDELDNIGASRLADIIISHRDKEDLVWIEERIKEHQKKQVTQTVSINKPYYRSKERW